MIKRLLIILFMLICVPIFAERKLTTNEAVKLAIGPFFDSTDGITPETGIDVTGLTVEIYREFDADTTPTRFANFVPTASGGSNDMVLVGSSVSGIYSLEVTAGQLNFTGAMILTIVDTDSAGIVGLPFWRYFDLTSANVVDAGYGTDKLQIDAAAVKTAMEAGGSTLAQILADTGTTLPGTLATIEAFVDNMDDRITVIRAGYLDELAAANLPADIANVPTVAEFNARTLVTADYFLFGSDAVANVTLVTTTTTNTDMVGEPLTPQEVEDTVWDAVLTGASHNTSNTAGKRLRQVEHTTVLRQEEQAQGGSASTITLHTDASSITGFYDDAQVVIIGDTGIGQSRHIHAYIGSTRVASITPDWITTPDNTSDYVIMADSEKHVHEIDTDAINAASTSSDYLVEINAEVDTALSDIKLDHLVNIAVDTSLTNTVQDNSVIGYMLAKVNVTNYNRTEDSGEGRTDYGDANWLTAAGYSTHDAAAVKTAMEANGSKLDHLWEMTEDDAGVRRLTTNALEQAPSGTGGDATAANQTTIINHLTAVKGSGFVEADNSLEAIRDRGDAAWTTGGGTGLTPLGSGTAQSGTASTIVLTAASTFANNELNNAVISIHTGTGKGQHRIIVTNTLSDDTCNISPNWVTTPSSDSQYEITQGSVTLADGVFHGGSTAQMSFKSMVVSNPNGTAVTFESTGAGGEGMKLLGNQSGNGLMAQGGNSGGHGFYALGQGSFGSGIFAESEDGQGGYGFNMMGDAGDIRAAEINDILADTNELQLDWANGGRLDLITDDIIDKLKAIMSEAYTLLTAVGTFDPATDSLEAQQESPQAPPIFD